MRTDAGIVLELATNLGGILGVLLWFPIAYTAGDVTSPLAQILGAREPLLLTFGVMVSVPLLAAVIMQKRWALRRVVRVVVAKGTISIEAHGNQRRIPLEEVQAVFVYRYPEFEAYGIDVHLRDGTRVEIRAWDPSATEANFVRDRLAFLVDWFRTQSP